MPGLAAPFTRCARQVGPPAFEGFEDEGFVRFDDPAQRSRLVGGGRAQKPMPPAEGRRRMNAAQLRGLGQALALDHRARGGPFLFLRRCAIGVLVSALKVRPQPCSGTATARASDPSQRSRGRRSADTPEPQPAQARRSARPPDAPACPALRPRRPPPPRRRRRARFLKRRKGFGALRRTHSRNRRQPSCKILSLHRIAPSIRPSLNQINS